MTEIFLSASVPLIDRGNYHETANPFLIQRAIRELVISVIRDYTLVWGGHPSITPMIWGICEDLGVNYSERVILYQSLAFKEIFPEENKKFQNVIFTEVINSNQIESLQHMREEMISREHLTSSVFVGGMDGLEVEHAMFKKYHPNGLAVLVGSPGGAALDLAKKEGPGENLDTIDFASLFNSYFGAPNSSNQPELTTFP